MFSTIGLFQGNEDKLVAATIAPVILIAVLVAAPALLASRAAVAVRAAAQRDRDRARRARRRSAPASGSSATRGSAPGPRFTQLDRLGRPVDRVLRAAGRARPRRARRDRRRRRGPVRGERDRRPAGDARRTSASSRRRAWLSCRRTASTIPTRSPTGSSCRRSRWARRFAMGMPALVREGMTWKDMRLRAIHAAPVDLRAAIEAKT